MTTTKIIKRILMPLFIVLFFSACQNNVESISNSESEVTDKPILFIVNPLREGNEYKVDDFKEIFEPYSEQDKYHYSDYEFAYKNLMPQAIQDAYQVGLYRVELIKESYSRFDFLLVFNKQIYSVTNQLFGDDPGKCGISNILFTDLNNDGFVEISTSYYLLQTLCSSSLHTLDTKTETFLRDDLTTNLYEYLYFEIVNGVPYIMNKHIDKESKELEKDAHTFSEVKAYSHVFHLNPQEKETLKSENYEANISLEEGTTTFPLIYKSLELRFVLNVEMTWLGETFTYTGIDHYTYGPIPEFINESKERIKRDEEILIDNNETYIVNTGDKLGRYYRFIDVIYNGVSDGDYDLHLDYRGEILIIRDALMVNNKTLGETKKGNFD